MDSIKLIKKIIKFDNIVETLIKAKSEYYYR